MDKPIKDHPSLTPLGNFLRRYRIKHSIFLIDMAHKLEYSCSDLSGMEHYRNGEPRFPIPDDLYGRLIQHYEFTENELSELKQVLGIKPDVHAAERIKELEEEISQSRKFSNESCVELENALKENVALKSDLMAMLDILTDIEDLPEAGLKPGQDAQIWAWSEKYYGKLRTEPEPHLTIKVNKYMPNNIIGVKHHDGTMEAFDLEGNKIEPEPDCETCDDLARIPDVESRNRSGETWRWKSCPDCQPESICETCGGSKYHDDYEQYRYCNRCHTEEVDFDDDAGKVICFKCESDIHISIEHRIIGQQPCPDCQPEPKGEK